MIVTIQNRYDRPNKLTSGLVVLLFVLYFSRSFIANGFLVAANGFVNNDQFADAIPSLRMALLIYPESATGHYLFGRVHFELGDYEQALEHLNKALEREQSAEAYYGRGLVYANLDNPDAALNDYIQAIRLNPLAIEPYYGRGLIYQQSEAYEQALQDFDHVLQLRPQLAEGYFSRGVTYYKMGKVDAALADFAHALSIRSNYAEVFDSRGVLYYEQQRYLLAIDDFTNALEFTPNNTALHCYRGAAYFRINRLSSAIPDLNRCLSGKLTPVERQEAEIMLQKARAVQK